MPVDQEQGEVTFQDLRPSEKLRLWRGRLGLSQEDAGRRFGVSAWVYGEMERGASPAPVYAWRGPFRMEEHERCLIYRLRAGVTQEHVAAEMGCSRLWVNQMENGHVGCDRLIEYWEC